MRNKLTDELAVCGLNAVLAIGEYHPQTINRLFLREERLQSFTGVCKQLAERKRPYKICEDAELERICKSVHHQGVVAMIEEPIIEPLSHEDLDDWAAEGKTGVVLHSVGNDHNLGAIARAAAFFDVSFIILNEKDSSFKNSSPVANSFASNPSAAISPNVDKYASKQATVDSPMSNTRISFMPAENGGVRLTTSAYRVAEGGFEHLTVRKVSNTAAFLKDASKKLITIGTDTRARMRLSDLSACIQNAAKTKPAKGRPGIALILGNEETGLPQNVKDQCSYLLRIPGTGNIDSLNVSQAAALFLYGIFEA